MQVPAEVGLAQRAQQGDPAAFAELFERLNQPLLNYLLHMVEDWQQAEDIGHEAFLRAYERVGQLGPPWDFKSWLYLIAGNLAVDWLRRRKRWADEAEESLQDEPPTTRRPVERKVDGEERRRRVRATLEGLATTSRQALLLRHVADLSYQEMARAMGCSPAAARQRVHRARIRFRDAYGLALVVPGGEARCRGLGEMLSAYCDNELSARERRLVGEHLSSCAPCHEAVGGIQQLADLMAGLPSGSVRADWKEDVLRETVGRSAPLAPAEGTSPGKSRPADRVSATARSSISGPARSGSASSTLWSLGAGLGAGLGVGLCLVASAAYLFQPGRQVSFAASNVTPSVTPSVEAYFSVDEKGVTRYESVTSLPPAIDPPIGGTPPPDSPSATSPTVGPLQVEITQNANCRAGPGSAYRVLTSLAAGSRVYLTGRNAAHTWWAIETAGLLSECWVFGEAFDLPVAAAGLPVLTAAPLPTETPTPVPACWVWMPNLQKSVCTIPCPANSQPGGTCTP